MISRPEIDWRVLVYLLYDIILFLASLFLIPYGIIKGARYGNVWQGLRERLGLYSPQRLAALKGKQVIWVHAVSVGEVRAAMPLVRSLKATYPAAAIVLSSMTFTGQAIARDMAKADLCVFFPFDLSWVVRRVFETISIDLVLIVETEIWPNFVRHAQQAKVPVVLVNGRISDRSFPRYRAIRPLIQPVLGHFSAFCMQSEDDARRITTLGAPFELIQVTGNLKFDMKTDIPDENAIETLKERYHLVGDHRIWVAGSTRPGEEEVLVTAYRQLVSEGEPVVLVLVPRHIDRCRAIADMLKHMGVTYVLRSALGNTGAALTPGEILLVDTMGEMLNLYATADLVFVGGSLVAIGGHNILEPAQLKKPVLFGPHMQNAKEVARLLLEAQGGMQVDDLNDLVRKVRDLISNPELRQTMGSNGYHLLTQNAGATSRTMAVIDSYLDQPS